MCHRGERDTGLLIGKAVRDRDLVQTTTFISFMLRVSSKASSSMAAPQLFTMLDVQPHHGFFIALLFLSGLAWLAARLTRRGQSQSQHLMEMHGCCEAPNVPQRPWLFGLDLLYESHVNMKHHTYLQSMQETFNTYGRTFQSHHLGKIMLSTIEPANIQAIVKTKASDYLARPARAVPLDGLVGHGILTADGEMWKRHRSLMKPSFNRKRLEDFAMYEEHVQHLLACIPRNDEAVDLRDLFFSFTINSATEHLFGSSCRSLAADNEASAGPDLADAFDRAQRASVEKFALGWADRLRPQIQYSRDTKRVRQFADHYVHKALKSKHERETDPEKLRRASTDSSGSGSTDVEAPAPKNVLEEFTTHTDSHDEIRAGLLHLMVGGRDTTASLLSNLWLCLARNPSIWRKLQAEISTLLGERPDANCLRRLPYLRQCIDECKLSPFATRDVVAY